ncbi:hypothetical protein [Streptomyces virginiae]|uniref:Uncharacterized protein n=1 Tax=Streptomyces virginiae TaxID=1961 RepID=A0ABZ1TNQ9_STRVG|nr:hypothetical protein [Streptomyces virginiae]
MTTNYLDVSAPSRIIGPDMPGEPGDEREKFACITEEYPDEVAEAARRAFLLSKLHSARTHPEGDIDDREHLVAALADRLGLDEQGKEEEVGGGVGYGFFYNEGFRRAFATGTSLGWDILCPDLPGGNVNNYLHLTAMNRAALGLEAFVSYYAQTAPRFKVYDWARPATPWQLDLPWSFMNPYLRDVPFHRARQAMGVTNTTVEVVPGTWRNTVHLWNASAGRYDLVYLFDYPATLAQQIAIRYSGSWGPIIETRQPSYSGTEPMGAFATSLTTRDYTGIWGPWAFLGRYDSYVRKDNLGFVVEFLDPNYNFAVKS